jgi:SRSO17 transposase
MPTNLLDRWGLAEIAESDLAAQARIFWERFGACFRTKTRENRETAWQYLRGLTTMDDARNFANIARRVEGSQADGQRIQHFMSDSPWGAARVYQQVQAEIAAMPELGTDGVLIVDESADAKAGPHSAGAGRQWNGRLGKVDLSQVGTLLAFAHETLWTWIDGELFFPEHWFTPAWAAERRRVGVPAERTFATKIELAWRMIQRATVPYVAVLCDDLYGRSEWFRTQLDTAKIVYMADVPANTQVYLECPALGVPVKPRGQRGKPPTSQQVINGVAAYAVSQVAQVPETTWAAYRVRSIERGVLDDAFAVRRVWTIRQEQVACEWLVMRRESPTRISYALSNAPAATPAARLVWLKCGRFAIECANREAKSELGWDDLQAQKYRAWDHHLALTVLASWFIAATKWQWSLQYGRDPTLIEELAVEVLPTLSVHNVRELLKASMPLPRLSQEDAATLVAKHLTNRARSTASRLRSPQKKHSP